MWWLFALLSAVFAALTSILAKVGIENVDSTLATAIRTVAVIYHKHAVGHFKHQQKKLDIPYPFRPCNGRIVALLLQSNPNGRCVKGCAD